MTMAIQTPREHLIAIYGFATDASVAAQEARDDAIRAEERAAREGHGEPCYYCQEPCNSVAGNPGRWPVALCHGLIISLT
jgi:hypothetical protein